MAGFSAPVTATVEPGINITFYDNYYYNSSPPLPEISDRPQVGTSTFYDINQNFDQSPFFGLYEDFIVKYEGFITSPIDASIAFLPTADDGTKFYLDGVLIDNNWRDKGGGGNVTAPQPFIAGVSRPFTYWFYENGGGAWTTLYWDIGNGWEVVPSSAFTKEQVVTTTTIAPYLNNPQNLLVTSTNETKVYLSWDQPEQSNVEVERYAIFYSCDSWSSGFAISSLTTSAVVEGLEPDSTCEFKIRADNDSSAVYSGWSNVVSGLTLPTTTSTTTTTIPETSTTTTTEVPVQETTPVETSPSQSDTTSNEPATSLPQYASEQTTTTTTNKPEVTSTTVPEEIVSQEVSALLEDASTLSEQQIQDAVADIVQDGINEKEAAALATDPDVIGSVTSEQAAEIFDAVAVSELSDEQAEQIIEAVQDAPKEVRNAFEEEINIFDSGKFDTYVPVGSTVNVSQRRSIIAAATGAVLALPSAGSIPGGSSGPSGGGSGPSGGGSGGGGSEGSSGSDKKRYGRAKQ